MGTSTVIVGELLEGEGGEVLKLYSIGCPPLKIMAHAMKSPFDDISHQPHSELSKNLQSFANEVQACRV